MSSSPPRPGHPALPPNEQPAWLQYQQYSPQYVAAQAQMNPTPRPTLRRWLLGGLIVAVSLVLASLFALLYGYSFGVVWTAMGLLAALLPLTVVLPLFLWLDRFEAEPWRYLVTAFLYGALGSTALAIVVNSLGGAFLMGVTDEESATMLTAVLIAPFTEETFKGLFLLVMWWFMRHEFNGLTDGIVYAGVVAAGFAFTENIQYFAGAAIEHGLGGFAMTFVMRGIVSPFLHPMFTTMTGIGVGLAAVSHSRSTKVLAPVLGWCAAVLLHGLWNLSASGTGVGLLLGLAGGFVTFVAFLTFVMWARRREGRIIGEFLMPYAATGWISSDEVGMLSSMKARRQARSWAKQHRGSVGTTSMRSFQDCASELALLRRRMHQHPVDAQTLHRERVLLDSMTARRREFAGIA
ncbi:PrsW family intramembrane metalloprotease [Janibacter alittae]|uniref:PrsW family intramembrane metalloprotease n=1 Tax=Janibacter alittae TaxID=3115209 RepID=A0ABZ2MES8_9MICO